MDNNRALVIASDFIGTMNNNGELNTKIKTYEYNKDLELDIQYEFDKNDNKWCTCCSLRDKGTEEIIGNILTCYGTDSVQNLVDIIETIEC